MKIKSSKANYGWLTECSICCHLCSEAIMSTGTHSTYVALSELEAISAVVGEYNWHLWEDHDVTSIESDDLGDQT